MINILSITKELKRKIFLVKGFSFLMLIFLVFSINSCSKDDGNLEESEAEVSFKLRIGNDDSKLSGLRIPACSESPIAYAEIVINGPENIGTTTNPFRVNIDSGTSETESLRLPEGTYNLIYFAVFDEADNMVWIAPNDTPDSNFVANPLPQSFNITAFNATTVDVDVVCLDDRTLNNEDALTAIEYVNSLGAGFDVTWSEFNRFRNLYQAQVPQDFSESGFKNVRIRMNEENPDADFISELRMQITDAIDSGLYPIIAYQGHYLEETATSDDDARQHLVEWWRSMAAELQDLPAELGFNILVEISGRYKNDATAINSFYIDVYDAIRETNPSRVIIFPPVNISNPEDLQNLEIPGGNDPYVMAEWHFYAAGPKPDPSSKKYWDDGSTLEERENITGPIQTAVDWMNSTGYVSWVGAWMAGNYNNGHDYNVEQQVDIASFITRTLNSHNIPFAVNAGNKYYDYENLEWFNRTTDAAGIPVRDALLNSEEAAIYADTDYRGNTNRLKEGQYTSAQLTSLGFYENISSVMVPFDFEVTLYDGDDLTGNSLVLDITNRNIGTFEVRSVKVEFLNSY